MTRYGTRSKASEHHARLCRRAQGRMRKLIGEMVRCQLPESHPTDSRYIALSHRPPCFALIFGHRIAEHLLEVHGLDYVPRGAFTPVGDIPEANDA